MAVQKSPTWDAPIPSADTGDTTRSFSRFESPSLPLADPPRTRAATLSAGMVPKLAEVPHDEVLAKVADEVTSPTTKAPDTFDELPIEIRSLTERFLESLTAPIHPTPLTIDNLSDLFQEFYTHAESHIAAHIATLSLKIGREKASLPLRLSSATRYGGRTPSLARTDSGEQQMLTSSEIVDRKKARRLLEMKKTAWEEIVERTVVERVYDRIYRHRSAEDEERDQKLRSRVASLAIVGIGLKELLSAADDLAEDVRKKTVEEQDTIRAMLAGARQNIQNMDTERYPLGKLQHLSLAHKSIVEVLSQLFPSTSSADEILPTLIYTLITSEPATLNVYSNLQFIQRFRAASKVDGEAAYCLVNLEAATSFLETVDLSSLRIEDSSGTPRHSSRPSTPRSVSSPMNLGLAPASDPAALVSPIDRPLPSPSIKQQRRLSNLVGNPINRINEATDVFRGALLDGADQAYDSIQSTLDNSFKILFGRMKEHQTQSGNDTASEDVLPKTLEDARKLVSTPPPLDEDADAASISTAHTVPEGEDPLAPRPVNDRVTELFGGRRPVRERSADSQNSGGSSVNGKKVAFDSSPAAALTSSPRSGSPQTPAPAANAAIEGMRSFGSSINPLNQLSRMSVIFSRSGSLGTSAQPVIAPQPSLSPNGAEKLPSTPAAAMNGDDSRAYAALLAAVQELKPALPANATARRIVSVKEAKELRLGDVEELLREYQRLVEAVEKTVRLV